MNVISNATTVVSSFTSSCSSTNLSFKLNRFHHLIGSIFNSVHSGNVHDNASTLTVTSLYVFSPIIDSLLYSISSFSHVHISSSIIHHVVSSVYHVHSSTIVHVIVSAISPVSSSTSHVNSSVSISSVSHVHTSATSHVIISSSSVSSVHSSSSSIFSSSFTSSLFSSSTENSEELSSSPFSSTTSSVTFSLLVSRISSYSHAYVIGVNNELSNKTRSDKLPSTFLII